jgi:uncharacterized protein (TIGR01777 family)
MYTNKKVIIIGGSGFIGTQLTITLQNLGADVVIIDPMKPRVTGVEYIKSDFSSFPDFEAMQNPFIIFNLAGVSIFGRWNKKYKNRLRTSRIDVTRILVEKFKNPLYKPEFFVSTSAIGVYGNRGDELLDENSKCIQDSFLAQLAHDWEQEALRAQELGVQVRIVRNAHVLGKGGLLGTLTKVFRWGIGGSLGKGKQYMSFVSIDRCIKTYIDAPFQTGATVLNAVSVEPISNTEFSKRFAKILRRPCLFKIPVFGIYILFGEFAKEIISSQRVHTLYNTELENLEEVINKVV